MKHRPTHLGNWLIGYGDIDLQRLVLRLLDHHRWFSLIFHTEEVHDRGFVFYVSSACAKKANKCMARLETCR